MSGSSRAIRRRIAVVTGTRAEYGLLRPVMCAIAQHPHLELQVLVTGTHLLPPQSTIQEIAAEFEIAASIPMQAPEQSGRIADANSLGRGVVGFAELFAHNPPDVLLVLGDRIEAFAAASAAAVAGVRVAHLHGGDRAEGIADESMRHAITKLAHVHLPATQASAQRILAMGEDPRRVHVVGSPAIDDLAEMPPLPDDQFGALANPEIIFMLHPVGDDDELEYERAIELLTIARNAGNTLALHPNHDCGRAGILRAIEESRCENRSHLPRTVFIGALRRAKLILGNSSAGLIEGAAIGIRCINVGPRQAGREMPSNVVNIPLWDYQTINAAVTTALTQPFSKSGQMPHPYGDGQAGARTAALLATFNPKDYPLAKRNTY